MSSNPPDSGLAVEKYRRIAATYDRLASFTATVRRAAVEGLRLKRGDVVVDVACGTGLTFELLEERIGPTGRIIGVDVSPDMLARAHERVSSHDWKNVSLIESAVEDVELPAHADAAVFVLTHDVMRSPEALRNILGQLKPGARVSAVGAKRPSRRGFPVNLVGAVLLRLMGRYVVTTTEGAERPWDHLGKLVPNLAVESRWLGAAYVARGTRPESGDSATGYQS